MKPDRTDAEAFLSRVVTNVVFYGGVFSLWVGSWITSGFGESLLTAGVVLIVAGAARWLFE
jgi:hypothetical protein